MEDTIKATKETLRILGKSMTEKKKLMKATMEKIPEGPEKNKIQNLMKRALKGEITAEQITKEYYGS